MTTVVALGGNALARRGGRLDIASQRVNVARAADAIAGIACADRVVVTHGNGPQVGMLAMQQEVEGVASYPLDVLDAETAGMIGYLLAQEIGRRLRPDLVATLLTQVVVDAADPAFGRPTKPIGLSARGSLRLVASPEPRHIVELKAIQTLNASGFLVVAGGGGIPVVRADEGGYRGVEAVVDKDLTSALLARLLGAETLLLLTDVDAVYANWGMPEATAIRRAGVDELRAMALPAGSMGPKVEAACRFVEQGGRALIGGLDDVAGLVAGKAGTEVAR